MDDYSHIQVLFHSLALIWNWAKSQNIRNTKHMSFQVFRLNNEHAQTAHSAVAGIKLFLYCSTLESFGSSILRQLTPRMVAKETPLCWSNPSEFRNNTPFRSMTHLLSFSLACFFLQESSHIFDKLVRVFFCDGVVQRYANACRVKGMRGKLKTRQNR
jgi:hypothetical protein